MISLKAHHYVNASFLMLWRPIRIFLDVRTNCRPNPRKLARRTNSWSMHFFANTSRFRTANDRKWDAFGTIAFRMKSPPREIASTSSHWTIAFLQNARTILAFPILHTHSQPLIRKSKISVWSRIRNPITKRLSSWLG